MASMRSLKGFKFSLKKRLARRQPRPRMPPGAVCCGCGVGRWVETESVTVCASQKIDQKAFFVPAISLQGCKRSFSWPWDARGLRRCVQKLASLRSQLASCRAHVVGQRVSFPPPEPFLLARPAMGVGVVWCWWAARPPPRGGGKRIIRTLVCPYTRRAHVDKPPAHAPHPTSRRARHK